MRCMGLPARDDESRFIDTLLILFALLLTEFVGDSHHLDRGKMRILFPVIDRPISVPFTHFSPRALQLSCN